VGDEVYAMKEITRQVAEREYEILRRLQKLELPTVTPIAVVIGRHPREGEPLEAILVTRHLKFSLPYRALFARNLRPDTAERLIDALAVLLVRLGQVAKGLCQGSVNIFGFELAAVIFSACGSAELACSSSALTDVAFSARGSIWGNSFNSMCSILRVVRDVCSFATTSARYVYGRFNSPHAAHCISLDLVCCASCKRSSSICRCRLSI